MVIHHGKPRCVYIGKQQQHPASPHAASPRPASPPRQGAATFTQPPSIRAGRIVIDLHDSVAPKAVQNFVCLCTGERGLGKSSGKPLHYKGCRFFRIVRYVLRELPMLRMLWHNTSTIVGEQHC